MEIDARSAVAVLGASGYAGGELVRLLARHPAVRLTTLAASTAAGRTLAEVHPHLASLPEGGLVLANVEEVDPSALASETSVVFCALPHGMSAELVPGFLEAGLRVIDLGGDFHRIAAQLVRQGVAEVRIGIDQKDAALHSPGAMISRYPARFTNPAVLVRIRFIRIQG